jgi:hypothetical protein
MINSAGQYIYFLIFIVNTSRYALTFKVQMGIFCQQVQLGLSLLLPPYHNLISIQWGLVRF